MEDKHQCPICGTKMVGGAFRTLGNGECQEMFGCPNPNCGKEKIKQKMKVKNK